MTSSPSNSCAYRSLPLSTAAISVFQTVSTQTVACQVCIYVSNGAQCRSLARCTASTTASSAASSTSLPCPTDISDTGGPILCYQGKVSGYGKFSIDDADNAINALCSPALPAQTHTLMLGETFAYSEAWTNNAGVRIDTAAQWAEDQSNCQPQGNYSISDNLCEGTYSGIMDSCKTPLWPNPCSIRSVC